jgi:hypothetical protein
MKKNRKIKRKNTATVTDRNTKSLALKNETDESLLIPNVHVPIKPDNEIEEDFQPVPVSSGEYQIPPVTLLDKSKSVDFTNDRDHYFKVSKQLELKLADFGVKGKVTGISPGPVITTYEFAPAPGIKITKVVSLVDDLTMGLKSEGVRIVGSIPGKAALGIEIPNLDREIVSLRDILASEKFMGAKSKLTMGLGMDVVGNPVLAVAGFASMKALSKRNDEPEKASRPFDKDRDGFVIAEGAGMLILEELEHARARGAKIYAEMAGYGLSGDGYHMAAPPEDGDGAVRCMQMALDDADMKPADIDYINAHGTSTPLNDVVETRAIKQVFQEHAPKLAISSTKSMTGHMLGGAGGIEAVFTALSIYHQLIPPTANLENPDPECDLDYVPGTARESNIQAAMSNSFGFGGTNAVVIMKRYGDTK